MAKAQSIQKTRKGGLYTCHSKFKDRFEDRTVPGEIYRLAKKCEYTSGKIAYIMIAKTFGIPAVMIDEVKFSKHFAPANCIFNL